MTGVRGHLGILLVAWKKGSVAAWKSAWEVCVWYSSGACCLLVGAVGRAGGKLWEGTHKLGGTNSHKKKKLVARSILRVNDEASSQEFLRIKQDSWEHTRKKSGIQKRLS